MEDSKLIFSLDCHDEGPTVAFSKDKPQAQDNQSDLSLGFDLDLSQCHRSQATCLPHSPSSPGSLADLSASSADPLVTTNLVKSSSTELQLKESSSLKGKPLLSLVKSLSTEISRRVEPEVNLSKSDSKLHLHPWKQLTQPKIQEASSEAGGLNENNDWESPLSTGNMSPTEHRGTSLIAELEDTRRRFSEAMQDPLSMLSKIMGDESPKQGRAFCAGDSPSSLVSSEEIELKCRKKTDGVCDIPLRKLQRGPLMKTSVSPDCPTHSRDSHFDIHTYGDMIQMVELQNNSKTYTQSNRTVPRSSLPLHWLFPVALLAYGFFVLPLPPYVTGLSVGVACGFILGLMVVFMFAPQRSKARNNRSRAQDMDQLDGKLPYSEILEVIK